MIIQRLTSALRKQEWSQVTVEVLIVIVGIFLGLQVQALYEERADREQETIYLNQLHEQVTELFSTQQRIYERELLRKNILIDVLNTFNGKGDISELNDDHCAVVARSHLLSIPTFPLPANTEISNSGQLSIFQDQKLRSLLSRISFQSQASGIIYQIISDTRQLPDDFPEMIKLLPPPDYEVLSFLISPKLCDFKLMSESQEFINALYGNTERWNRNILQFQRYRNLIDQLHSELDHLLGLSHEEET
ncbi:MAG: hypothetical protein HOM63_11640 [Kordiimonadaceae bacterium]|jgi:hypothetical protein|nr:hypothetical protein [Kordiimonadaceae bacterium]